jgi:hypothetical protein
MPTTSIPHLARWHASRLVLEPLSPSIASDPVAQRAHVQLQRLLDAIFDPCVSREELIELTRRLS